MNNSIKCNGQPTRDILLTSTGLAIVFGLVEWLIIGDLGFELLQGKACRTIFITVIVYGLFGLILATFCCLVSRLKKWPNMAVSFTLCLLIALAVFREKQNVLLLAAAFALGWLCHLVFKRITSRYAFLCRPRLWWIIQGFLLAAALALTAFRAPSMLNVWISVGVACITSLLLVWDLLKGAPHIWRYLAATVIVVIACWFLGFRVQVQKPIVAANTDRPSVLLRTAYGIF